MPGSERVEDNVMVDLHNLHNIKEHENREERWQEAGREERWEEASRDKEGWENEGRDISLYIVSDNFSENR